MAALIILPDPASAADGPKVTVVKSPKRVWVHHVPRDIDKRTWSDVLVFCDGTTLYGLTELESVGFESRGGAGGGLTIVLGGCTDGAPRR